jgi:hypothetical protein
MSLVITHRSLGSEAYLLERGDHMPLLLYDRFSKKVTEVDVPARFLGRANWIEFDGDPEPILQEVQDLLR